MTGAGVLPVGMYAWTGTDRFRDASSRGISAVSKATGGIVILYCSVKGLGGWGSSTPTGAAFGQLLRCEQVVAASAAIVRKTMTRVRRYGVPCMFALLYPAYRE